MRQMKKKIIIAIIVTLLLTATVAFTVSHFIIKDKDEQIAELNQRVVDTKCLAFANDLTVNSIITQSDLKEIEIKDSSVSSGTYKVIDGDKNHDEVYREFKEYYMNSDIPISEVRSVLGLTQYMYVKLKNRVVEETGYQRPHYVPPLSTDEGRYIHETASGKFRIQKTLCGKAYHCGAYPTFETAVKVRGILEDSDWDLSLLPFLKEKYSKECIV